MHPSVKSMADLYAFHHRVLEMTIKGIQEEDQFVRPMNKGNSINFIVGHITSIRFAIARMLGDTIKAPWGDIYDQGQSVVENSAYPVLSELLVEWKAIADRLPSLLGRATEEILLAAPPFEGPGQEKNLRGTLAFLLTHEAIHLGQLAYVRRLLGYPQAFDR